MKSEPDPWLAAIFGRPVFRISILDADDPECLLSLAQHEPNFSATSAFGYTKIPTQRTDQLWALTRLGFAIVDVNVIFERNVLPGPDWPTDAGTIVRAIQPPEHATVQEIAASCFVYSRFHLDPQIPSHIADRIKRDWVGAYVRRQRGERLWVAVREGNPVGFLAELRTMTGGHAVGVIDLMGVARNHQGHGIARSLIDCFIRNTVREVSRLRVGTQAANVPSIRLYEKCGFRVIETLYVLHAHIHNGKVQR